ncbi:MAG: helix-turn-helix transcriptional regulator [Syntrophobacteraceae bacterium]|nr:helix-turn-helix transcriptional regulator [Syntrophobacteraceae bacterium]
MTEIDFKIVGERLERFREIRGLSRTVVAQRLGIARKDLEDAEAGEKPLRKEWVETLRDAFALDPAWLLGGRTLEDL